LHTQKFLAGATMAEKSLEYLLGKKSIKPYRLIYVILVYVGVVVKLDLVWTLADIMNGLMALPNLVALMGLSGIVAAETRNYFKKLKTKIDFRIITCPGQLSISSNHFNQLIE
jgi:Na+/alanine symporter